MTLLSDEAGLRALLNEYAESHQNPVNQALHKICVPLIEWGLLGILWSLPRPESFGDFTWAHGLMIFALAYYLRFRNWKVMAASLLLAAPFWIYVAFDPPAVLMTSVVVFLVAWVGQFYGHHLEGKKPSFLRDVFFLLIGPLWVAHRFHRLVAGA